MILSRGRGGDRSQQKVRQEVLDLLKNQRGQSSVKLLGTVGRVVNCSILGDILDIVDLHVF